MSYIVVTYQYITVPIWSELAQELGLSEGDVIHSPAALNSILEQNIAWTFTKLALERAAMTSEERDQ